MKLTFALLLALTLAACTSDTSCDETAPDTSADVPPDVPESDSNADSKDTSDVRADVALDPSLQPPDPVAAEEALHGHCNNEIGPPRVEELAPGLWVAIGYDLANTIVLETPEGNVVIDVGMSELRAAATRAAIEEQVPGDIAAVVYTHSHIDHVGGALAWAEDDTPIWATDAFAEHFVKQYGAFAIAETRRGNRQFGLHVSDEELPCSGLGRRADVDAALETGALMPTETFSEFVALDFGGVQIELHEAHGETHDQLYVWIPHLEALLPGDNYYAAFPNLYTIRGTSPRDVDAWIESLDRMRAHDPALLVPSHTSPVIGQEAIRGVLTSYRDGIQWLRDGVVRAANRGESLEQVVRGVQLPPHLAERAELQPLYGQVDWSVRAIYGNNLGWFDERSSTLYPPADAARREIEMMGGASAVLAAAEGALGNDDPRWALHLLDKLAESGMVEAEVLGEPLGRAYASLASGVANTNGRGWLLESAAELVEDFGPTGSVIVNDRLVQDLPVEVVFDVLPSRLDVEAAGDQLLSVALDLDGRQFVVTVRSGIAEVIEGEPLPGGPAISATISTDEVTWKRIALGVLEPTDAVIDGDLSVDNLAVAIEFLGLFQR